MITCLIYPVLQHPLPACTCFITCSPVAYQSLGPLAPKPYTYNLIGMLGAIIMYMTIILLGYTAVGITGGCFWLADFVGRYVDIHSSVGRFVVVGLLPNISVQTATTHIALEPSVTRRSAELLR